MQSEVLAQERMLPALLVDVADDDVVKVEASLASNVLKCDTLSEPLKVEEIVNLVDVEVPETAVKTPSVLDEVVSVTGVVLV